MAFPRPLTGAHDPPLGFSFSGLKTAVARYVEKQQSTIDVADVAASFQEAVADVLTRKALLACRQQDVDTLVIVGGVAANSRIRALAQERCDAAGVQLRVPPMRLCTDNGAMIAAIGDLLVRDGAKPSAPGPVGRADDRADRCTAGDGLMPTLMWEARAAAGRLDDLLEHVLVHADPAADVYRSGGDGDLRVVVIDPTGRGIDDVPGDLVARPPHVWPFEPVPRG